MAGTDPITQHHLNNLSNGTAVKNPDGSVSTVRTIQVDLNGKPTLIPTVWDGQIVSDQESVQRAIQSGIQWPTADTHEQLRQFDINIHKKFDKDLEKSNYRSSKNQGITNLDLSFVQIEKNENSKVRQSDVLDLSFLDEKPASVDNRSTLKKIGDFFSGADRETASTRELDEFDLPFEFSKRQAKTALGLLTTFDPLDQAKILKANYPEIKFEEDEKGNIIADGTAYGGGKGILNMPGVSPRDLLQAGFTVAAFTPAGRLATGSTIGANAVRVGAGSAATQTAIDLVSQASGREEDVSAGNVRVSDVAVAGVGGAGFQALFQGLGKAIPALRKRIAESGITDEIRSTVKQTAIKLGLSADDVTDDVIAQIVKEADQSVSPGQAMSIQGEKEFSIPLTSGQRSLDDVALSFEDRARVGLQGEKAQRIMRGFEQEVQLPAVNAAKQKIEKAIGGQTATRQETGDIVRRGIQEAESSAKSSVESAYSSVGDARLTPSGFIQLIKATKQAAEGIDFPNSKDISPSARQLKKTLDSVLANIGKNDSVVFGTKLLPVHVKEIERIRKAINAYASAASNRTDLRNVTVMKNSFDDYLDDAVKNALFEGDEASLKALKNARSIFNDYAKKFRSQGKSDSVGKFIEKIISDNPTDEQIVNAIFGASNFTNTSGQRMAARFKEILGPESDGWKAIRQEAFRRLIKTNKVNNQDLISGQQTLKAINDAMDKNASLMNEIFTKEEISLFRRFAAQVKRTQPDLVRSRENPSGTAQVAGKTLSNLVSRIAGIIGEPTIFVGAKGVEALKGLKSSSKAKSAVRPFEKFIQANPELVGGSTGATMDYLGNN